MASEGLIAVPGQSAPQGLWSRIGHKRPSLVLLGCADGLVLVDLAEHQTHEHLGRLGLHAGHHVGIGVEGEGHRAVAESPRHDLRVDTCRQTGVRKYSKCLKCMPVRCARRIGEAAVAGTQVDGQVSGGSPPGARTGLVEGEYGGVNLTLADELDRRGFAGFARAEQDSEISTTVDWRVVE